MPKIVVEFNSDETRDKINVDVDDVQPSLIYIGGIALLKIASEHLTSGAKDDVLNLIDELMALGGFNSTDIVTIPCD